MDLSTSRQLLIDFLSESDSYNSLTDYKRLAWDEVMQGETPTEDECRAAIEACLSEMVQNDFLTPIEKGSGKNKHTIYIVNNSLKNQPIEVLLSRNTCENIATAANSFLPLITLEKVEPIKPKNVGESEILLLLEIISALGNQLNEFLQKEDLENSKKQIKDNKNQNPPNELGGIV